MILLPAIDLYEGKAVRLYKGDYAQMTVYSEDPPAVAADFAAAGAEWIHLVDLEGARSGTTPNFAMVRRIRETSGLRCEIGGGVRSMETVDRYMDAGIDRVILGTAAVTEPGFAEAAVRRWGERIAVGADIRDGRVALRGWTESAPLDAFTFAAQMEAIGVRTLIVTDISRDGAMQGTNLSLYETLSRRTGMRLVASGGVSSLDDVRRLRAMGLWGAIVGKAYYTGAISLKEAIETAV